MQTQAMTKSGPSALVLGICLFLAVSMCSSAGVVFDILTNTKKVPPFLAVFWRLFLQNIVQFFPFVFSLHQEWRRDTEKKLVQYHKNALDLHVDGGLDLDNEISGQDEGKQEDSTLLLPRYVNSLTLCLVSGFFLGVHFSMWVYSLRYTSLTHSLLWVTMGPICINGASWSFYLLGQVQYITSALAIISVTIPIVRRPSTQETCGALAGIGGAIIMLTGVQRNGVEIGTNAPEIQVQGAYHEPTLYGDAAAFLGAVAVCVYLVIGQNLRSFLPIWLYVFPVVGTAALASLIFALFDDEDPSYLMTMTPPEKSVFGFLSKEYFLYALYLGVGPGICGHTMLNTLLKYVSPLIISTAMLSEPILGSIIGYYLGLQPLPGAYTWIGGGALIIGLVLVVVGENGVRFQVQNQKACETSTRNDGYGSFKDYVP